MVDSGTRFLLSTIVTTLFFALVLVMAFRPEWLSADVSPKGIEAPALVLTFVLLLLTIGAMGLFCWLRAHGSGDGGRR